MQLGDGAIPVAQHRRCCASGSRASRSSSCSVRRARTPDGLAAAEQLLGDRPEIGAILITHELSTDLFRRALRAGVQDVLPAPVDTVAAGRGRAPRGRDAGQAAPVPTASAFGEVGGELGRVITVFSTKGGAGKSVIATNLAVILAQRSDRAGRAGRRRPAVR